MELQALRRATPGRSRAERGCDALSDELRAAPDPWELVEERLGEGWFAQMWRTAGTSSVDGVVSVSFDGSADLAAARFQRDAQRLGAGAQIGSRADEALQFQSPGRDAAMILARWGDTTVQINAVNKQAAGQLLSRVLEGVCRV